MSKAQRFVSEVISKGTEDWDKTTPHSPHFTWLLPYLPTSNGSGPGLSHSHLPLLQSPDSHHAVSILTHAGLTTMLIFCPQAVQDFIQHETDGEQVALRLPEKGKTPVPSESKTCRRWTFMLLIPRPYLESPGDTHHTHICLPKCLHVTANSRMEGCCPSSYPHLFPVQGWGQVHGKIVKLIPEEPVTTCKHSHLEPFCLWLQQMGQAKAEIPQGLLSGHGHEALTQDMLGNSGFHVGTPLQPAPKGSTVWGRKGGKI